MQPTIDIKIAISTWIETVLSNVSIIWEGQNIKESEIDYPYISLRIHSLKKEGCDHKSMSDNSGDIAISGNIEALLIINYYGENGLDDLQKLVDSYNLVTIKSLLNQNKLVLIQKSAILDVSDVFNNSQENRFQVEYIIRTGFVTKVNVGYIETVDIESEFPNTNVDTFEDTIDTTP